MILSGKTGELEQKLREEMEAAAEALEFEKAADLRDRIAALSILGKKQKIVTASRGRIAASGMAQYFDRVFISEQMGCKKPDKLFYDKVFAEIGEDYRAQSIMIGDSLSSDMQGGRNAGIPTCLFGRTEPISPLCDYAVADLLELPALLAPL